MITNRLFITLTFLVISPLSYAQDSERISLPAWNDKYSEFVRQLEAGNTKIDYREFRYSFLESKQFQIKTEKRTQYDSLKMEMIAQAGASHYSEVIRLSKAMLNIETKICDKMEVVNEDGKDEIYYFDVTKLLSKSTK